MNDDNVETAIEALSEVIESIDNPSTELIDLCEQYLRRAEHVSRGRRQPARTSRYH